MYIWHTIWWWISMRLIIYLSVLSTDSLTERGYLVLSSTGWQPCSKVLSSIDDKSFMNKIIPLIFCVVHTRRIRFDNKVWYLRQLTFSANQKTKKCWFTNLLQKFKNEFEWHPKEKYFYILCMLFFILSIYIFIIMNNNNKFIINHHDNNGIFIICD